MKNVSHSVVHFLDAGNISLQYFQPVSVYLYIYIFLNFDIIESMIESSFRHSKRIKKITGLMIFFLYRSDIERELDAYCQYKMTIMQSSQSLDVANISQCDVQIQLSLPTNLYSINTQRKAHINMPLLSWSADSAKQGQWLIITNNELPYVYVFCFFLHSRLLFRI